MEINFDEKRVGDDGTTHEFVRYLKNNEKSLGLEKAQLYHQFPILKDADDQVIIADFLLLSPDHGIVVLQLLTIATAQHAEAELERADRDLEHVFSLIYSRLIRNKNLRKRRMDLAFPVSAVLFAPNLEALPHNLDLQSSIAMSFDQLASLLQNCRTRDISGNTFTDLVATLEGAKGLIRPTPRPITHLGPRSKGALANQIESELASFDRRQKQGSMVVLDGLQRIRGLAGSGKTVVLAMKAALTHLREPDAFIVYTFYTKSLYQHIRRLITRFYRQFEDTDPDWSRLKVIHGWGGYTGEGVYFNACQSNGVTPVNLSEAKARSRDPFDFACRQLLSSAHIKPDYDYIFVDEGQDFPTSFIQLCVKLAEGNRVVFAYDDLQTIFQPTPPEIDVIIGRDKRGRPLVPLTQDVILYKCYRNPREILLCAHAVGFGVYGRIVQMLENREQWEDIGYKVVKGDFVPGSLTVIERPAANSLTTISMNQQPHEIVQASVYGSFKEEIDATVECIKRDMGEGLRPDDILIIVVDDRNAKNYLRILGDELTSLGVKSNNLHEDSYGIRDFQRDGHVTLSTVHKAKGNEAFMVYVLGVDALYSTYAGVRERNVLFTAMTRAKGWVRVSGIGAPALECKTEIEDALDHFPQLIFDYPSQEQLKIIKRDLEEGAAGKQKAERMLDQILDQMTPDEITRFLEQRAIKKGK